MAKGHKRKRLLLYPNAQLKHVGLSVIPAAILSLFCLLFFYKSGTVIFESQQERLLSAYTRVTDAVGALDGSNTRAEDMNLLTNNVKNFEQILKGMNAHIADVFQEVLLWMFAALLVGLVIASLLSLLYSHRIFGPIFRVGKYISALNMGKDIPPVRLRIHDQFADVAIALDNLRRRLKNRNLLE